MLQKSNMQFYLNHSYKFSLRTYNMLVSSKVLPRHLFNPVVILQANIIHTANTIHAISREIETLGDKNVFLKITQ